jgi:uncharacterized protein YuzE
MERVNITIGPLSFDHADYDAENDVLYLHVGEPQAAEGEETPEGHVIRYARGTNQVAGLTVLGARRILERDGHLVVTVPETVETTAEDLAPALAARWLKSVSSEALPLAHRREHALVRAASPRAGRARTRRRRAFRAAHAAQILRAAVICGSI